MLRAQGVGDRVADEVQEGARGVRKLLESPDYAKSARERQVELLERIRQLDVLLATIQRDLQAVIDEAQRQGATWRAIGEAQGISAQAAQQRAARYRHRRE